MSRKERMYGKSPKMERDEDGKMGVKKADKAQKVESETEGVEREGDGAMPMHVRHAQERRHMHERHETEHALHDHHEHGSKENMHERHHKEHKDMMKRHEKEIMKDGSMEGEKEKSESDKENGKTGKDNIEKIETDKKE